MKVNRAWVDAQAHIDSARECAQELADELGEACDGADEA